MKPDINPSAIPQRNSTRHRGFTLVELLVVVTIIIVLATLAFFMTRKIRERAYQANAMSSLRQIAAFSVAYSTENNGDINTLRYKGDPKEGTPWVGGTFWGRLQPYLFADLQVADQNQLKTDIDQRLDGLFNTRDADKMTNSILSGAKIYHDTSGLAVPIAFNSNLQKWGVFLKVSSFSDPTQVLYAAYGFGMFDETDGKTYVPRPQDGSAPKNNIYYLDDRKALVSFLDGHVDLLSVPIPERYFK